jgi:arylsulfatase A-like enzyme
MAETFDGKPNVQRYYNQHWGFDTLPWETWQCIIAAYWGYVSLIDEQVGRLLDALERNGFADDTVVIFTSDHGGFAGNHRLADKGPAMYDDIYRIPLIVRDPQAAERGNVSQAMVSLIAIMPTVLDIAGADIPGDLDAVSFLPLLRDPSATGRDWITAEFHGHHFPYPQRMIRTRRYKLVISPADKNELYDLTADPYELNNLYDHPGYTSMQQELTGRLYRHLVAAGDNFHHWMPTMYTFDAEAEAVEDQALIR